MAAIVTPLAIDGLLVIEPERHGDERGFFSETYSARTLAAHGVVLSFVQDNHVVSSVRGTVRGLHFQSPPHAQAKLVRVARGAVLCVVLDLRRGSPSYGQHVAVELSRENWRQILVPVGLAHGYCTLEPNTELLYKVTAFYEPAAEGGILWNDPALGIAWPDCAGICVSARDAQLPTLADIQSPFVYQPGGK